VAAADSVLVTATVARENVPNGAAIGSLVLTSDAVNGPASVAVEVASTSALSLGVHVLDHRVVDAEFSAVGGLLVTVSATPNRLNIIDVETGAIRSVDLPQVPTCVAIRPDGAFAAVGHDGYVTVINLTTRAVTRTYAVTTDALDIILPANGYVYVFPRRDQWESIRSINLATGVETPGSGYSIYAGTLGRLHPSGDFIYGANNGLSPSDFEKYDIRKGTLSVMYDSPYHGDYAFSGNVWISEDGTRLFARSGNVFRSSPVQAEDMRYAGKLAGVNAVRWAADSRARSRVYVLGAGDAPFNEYRTSDIKLFESGFLAFQGAAALPKMNAGGTPVDVDGHFLFVGAGGTRVYVLLKAVASAGLAQDWALAVLDAATLP
jgi:chitinase